MNQRLAQLVFTAFYIMAVAATSAFGQVDEGTTPVIVLPGAPGTPTRVLPANTTAKLSQYSKNDVEFMQGMIHHHSQAVDMVALMEGRTTNKELLLLGARISHSQAAEMEFMKRWLQARGEKTTMQMDEMKMNEPKPERSAPMKMDGMDHSKHMNHKDTDSMLMPGMLTAEQMKALAEARGAEFDRLFLTGMIQHHGGALTMVYDLFDSAGAGQDAQLFNFATDVDSGQRAEIRIMEEMLKNIK
ncbi:MAG: DUF305 domain-containing protein [Pyrinomonadaceae bacterium]